MKSVYVYPPKMMADAVLSQANPVSTTLHTVLATTKNVRIISIGANLTWATTQPTQLIITVTVDGQTLTFNKDNPVSAASYYGEITDPLVATQQISGVVPVRAFLFEGRSVKVEVSCVWAITQPTPLTCRVKYAKY